VKVAAEMDPRWMNQTPTDKLFPVSDDICVRRAPRRKVTTEVDLVSHYWDHPVAYELKDLSPFGMWIDTLCPLHQGAEVVVSFQPPGGQEVTVFGTVRRALTGRRKLDRGRVGMGIEFTDITYDEMVMVDKALRVQLAA
jgi:PilZ domain